MNRKVVAVVGTYRKGGTVDSAVDLILQAAEAKGARVTKFNLLEEHIEFCTNCRHCTQSAGPARGACLQNDGMDHILNTIEGADAVVFASPVNYFNVTALFRRFLERMVCYSYWPWGQKGPRLRVPVPAKKAVLVTSTAMPGAFIPWATGAPRALKAAAAMMGARPVAKLWLGLAASEPNPALSERARRQAVRIGEQLA